MPERPEVALVLDTGALIAFDRGDRAVAALVEATRRRSEQVMTSSGCVAQSVAQSWRGGARQALLARLLRGVDEKPLGPAVSRAIGELSTKAATDDVVDAHVALLAHDPDLVLTSDPTDLKRLLAATRSTATVKRC